MATSSNLNNDLAREQYLDLMRARSLPYLHNFLLQNRDQNFVNWMDIEKLIVSSKNPFIHQSSQILHFLREFHEVNANNVLEAMLNVAENLEKSEGVANRILFIVLDIPAENLACRIARLVSHAIPNERMRVASLNGLQRNYPNVVTEDFLNELYLTA